jgi:hypothetical protein
MHEDYNELRDRVQKTLAEFEVVLDQGPEAAIHAFLAMNVWMLTNWSSHTYLALSKFRLADIYETDFLTIGSGRLGWLPRPQVTFVEIERANEKLFNKKGDPSSFLIHAIRQVQDWKAWVSENRDFLTRRLRDIITHRQLETGQRFRYLEMFSDDPFERHFDSEYLVIAGRHRGLSTDDAVRFAQLNEDLSGIHVLTYDKLIERVRDIADRDRHFLETVQYNPPSI